MADSNSENLKFIRLLQEEQKKLNETIANSKDLTEYRKNQEDYILNKKTLQNEQERLISESRRGIVELTKDEEKELEDIVKQQKNINTQADKEVAIRKKAVGVLSFFTEQLKLGWTYLQASDKIIKSTILSLGMSGAKAEMMRHSFEQSIGHVSILGGSLEDIQGIMQGYADVSGKARVLSAQMVEDITAIGKGTGLGVEEATKLGAQFEFMGLDARKTMEFVQGTVDTTERMGINTTKVLKNVSDNFRKLSTFTFQKGVKAFADMAISAEKTRVSMATTLDVAEATRGLEQVIELGANLQVMGGNFSKMDPFEWIYKARNEPEKLTEDISKMTAGIYTLRKNSEGTFEKFISPEDRDRLANVAKSLGIAQDEMFEIAQRRLDISAIEKETAGLGLSKKQKDLIAGAAQMDSKTGRYQVMLAGTMRDISTLTTDQAKSFASEQVLLKDRAKEAQTFDEAFKNTVNALKGALLPLLDSVNKFLVWIRPMTDKMGEWAGSKGGLVKAATMLIAAAGLWKVISFGLGQAGKNWFETGSMMRKEGKAGGGLGTFLGRKGAGTIPTTTATPTGGGMGGGRAAGVGAGIGAAALGVGAGIGLAAVGISKLADSMEKLDPEKAKILAGIVRTLAISIGVVGIAAGLIIVFGAAAGAAALPLLAFGGAVALIGAGIGIAAAGIGVMGMGLAKLVESSKGAGKDMLAVGGGIAAIAASLALLNFSGLGLGILLAVMGAITVSSLATAKVASAFEKMGVAMKGSKEDFLAAQNAIESISKANIGGGSMLADLANLLKSPLKVEFTDKNVAVVSDITLNIDGEKFMNKIYKPTIHITNAMEARAGTGIG
jgi:hypothetical protein